MTGLLALLRSCLPSDQGKATAAVAPLPSAAAPVCKALGKSQLLHAHATRRTCPDTELASTSMRDELVESAPYLLTALDPLGNTLYQSPMSCRYYGDASQWQIPAGEQLHMLLLQELFRLEGEDMLQDMLAAVLDTGSAGGSVAAGTTSRGTWRRVMQVPASCHRSDGTSRSPRVASSSSLDTPFPCIVHRSPSAHASQPMATAQPTPPHLPHFTCAVEDSADGPLPRQSSHPHPLTSGDSYQQPKSPRVHDVEAPDRVSAVSVAIRSANGKFKSLIELSMASQSQRSGYAFCSSANASTSLGDAGAAASGARPSWMPPLRSGGKGKSLDLGLSGKAAQIESWSSRSLVQKQVRYAPSSSDAVSDAGALAACGSMQALALGESLSGDRNAPPVAAWLGPSRWLSGIASPCVEHGSAVQHHDPDGTIDEEEDGARDLESRLLVGSLEAPRAACRASRLTSALPPRSARPGASDLPTSAAPSAPATPAYGPGRRNGTCATPATRPSSINETAATCPCCPQDVPRGTSPGAVGGDGKHGFLLEGDAAAAGRMEEQEDGAEQGCCWHEVFVTRGRDKGDGRPLLLVYQTDVTVRTHLEATMAQLTETQLDTLCQLFPRHVIEYLSVGATSAHPTDLGHLARSHTEASILFLDIAGFTNMSKQVPPNAVMTFLNELFLSFDSLCAQYGVHKVETAGDCYIASCGILSADEDGYSQVSGQHDPKDSMARMFAFAKAMLAASRLVCMPHDGSPVVCRIGIHTGPCVSGVVGSKLPKFAVFGDTMNTASRMESTCAPGRIQLSGHSFSYLMASGASQQSEWQATGGIEVKGKGRMDTFLWVEPAPPGAPASVSQSTPKPAEVAGVTAIPPMVPVRGIAAAPVAVGVGEQAAGPGCVGGGHSQGQVYIMFSPSAGSPEPEMSRQTRTDVGLEEMSGSAQDVAMDDAGLCLASGADEPAPHNLGELCSTGEACGVGHGASLLLPLLLPETPIPHPAATPPALCKHGSGSRFARQASGCPIGSLAERVTCRSSSHLTPSAALPRGGGAADTLRAASYLVSMLTPRSSYHELLPAEQAAQAGSDGSGARPRVRMHVGLATARRCSDLNRRRASLGLAVSSGDFLPSVFRHDMGVDLNGAPAPASTGAIGADGDAAVAAKRRGIHRARSTAAATSPLQQALGVRPYANLSQRIMQVMLQCPDRDNGGSRRNSQTLPEP